MKDMDTNTIISWALAAMGIIAVVGWIIISIKTGTSSGTEVPISIISGLSGVLTGKNIAESKMKHEKEPQPCTKKEDEQNAD